MKKLLLLLILAGFTFGCCHIECHLVHALASEQQECEQSCAKKKSTPTPRPNPRPTPDPNRSVDISQVEN